MFQLHSAIAIVNPARVEWTLRKIHGLWSQWRCASDAEIRAEATNLRFDARCGIPPAQLLPKAYALACEAARRSLGISLYDAQIRGAIRLVNRSIVEMETGEGKSLTATLPLFLFALPGEGAHLATPNDYLARRDANIMRPLFEMLGLTTGVITSDLVDEDRIESYGCDITYGTATEFGFDLLRDRLKRRATAEQGQSYCQVQRDLFFCIVDEADAVLVDEANMPMIIGTKGKLSDPKQRLIQWASQVAPRIDESTHYRYDLRTKKVELNKQGRNWVRTLAGRDTLPGTSVLQMYSHLETAISVVRDYHRDRQYIISDGQIILVSEATGRLGEGRQWQDGLHQAIQAREGLEVTPPNTHSAKITIQNLFLSYRHIAGMTGTAKAAARELRGVYKLNVVRIPPQFRSRRRTLATKYFSHEKDKWAAICAEIQQLRAIGRPTLIGTRSVEKSEQLSAVLDAAGVPHRVLNAQRHQAEAEIIATAGQRGMVTVATGMAGRGTDIRLAADVLDSGGLHVVMTELHDSPRMDRQLLGRCGRQGDPGTCRQYLSLDDEILDLAYGLQTADRLRQRRHGSERLLRSAQWRLERQRRGSRLAALYHEKRKLRSIWELGRDPLLDST
jgi:preprotein translocase subunit SecA